MQILSRSLHRLSLPSGTLQRCLHAFALGNRGVIRLSGTDTRSFLQGILATDIRRLTASNPLMYTSFLSSQGRILYDAICYHFDEDIVLLDVAQQASADLFGYLKKYKLRKKVNIRDVTEDYIVATTSDKAPGSIACAIDPRHPSLGYRALFARDQTQAPIAALTEEETRDYILRRYLLGIPEGPQELAVGESFPFESNLDYINGVSVSKGCYVGQELTNRTYTRGAVRKRIIPFYIKPAALPLDAPSGQPLRQNPEDITVDRSMAFPRELIGQDLFDEHANPGRRSSPSYSGAIVGRILAGCSSIGLAQIRLDSVVEHRHLLPVPPTPTPASTTATSSPPSSVSSSSPLMPPTSPHWHIHPFIPSWWPEELGRGFIAEVEEAKKKAAEEQAAFEVERDRLLKSLFKDA